MEISLSVELSTPEGSIALYRHEGSAAARVFESTLGGPLRHTEAFLPHLQEALAAASLSLAQIDTYLTTIGPGSFTGLRIALASLKALSFAQQKPIETFRNSEIRLLQAVAEKPYAGDSARVLTQASVNRVAIAAFRREPAGWNLEAEEIVDLPLPKDTEDSALFVHDHFTMQSKHHWPAGDHRELEIAAGWLAKFRLQARSRQICRTEKEWIELSPLYLGSRF